DGDRVTTGIVPLGELLAAERASGAPVIESASSGAPSGVARLALRTILPVMHLAPLRRLTIRLLAGTTTRENAGPRRHSWAHAQVTWADGTTREGWLRLGDANAATASVATEVASRLADGRGTPGVYTPAELFGTELVESCGGVYSVAD
ncbi:MAG: hypothetical protein ACTH31_02540, partial [Pseudoclavibacter sp.]